MYAPSVIVPLNRDTINKLENLFIVLRNIYLTVKLDISLIRKNALTTV
ncbi:hypothetical protein FEDK69T_16600 [Flavobacterium enshiense DK69]|nr:hypothetical protein FEDK69T_16600 [Flavobacterium enshiense DK69]